MAKIITFATLRKTRNRHYDSGAYFFHSKYDATFFVFYLGSGFLQDVSAKQELFSFQQIARSAERFPVKTV